MPDFTPTAEQQAAVDFATGSDRNLALVARAGAAKTSTLVLIAEALPYEDILCLAFNKKIALEMEARLPPNCTSKTLHQLGYRAWFEFIRKKCKLNDRKVFQLLKGFIDDLGADDKKAAYESMAETLDFIKTGKNAGWLPQEFSGHWNPLLEDEPFFEALPMEPSGLQIDLMKKVSSASFKLAFEGELDFADMILCPAICSISWPRPDITLVDEAQDLSPLNHHMLRKIVKKRRLIAVGDPCQAIYGFRGADTRSMENMIRAFDMEELRLTISFRCARAITENARWRAEDMRSPDWAEEGQVLRPAAWSVDDIQIGDAIICRNNAPLFSMAIKMIEAGLLPEIAGRDIGAPLRKIMKKLGKPNMLRAAAIHALDDWKTTELKRAREGAGGMIEDHYRCVLIFLERTKTLGDAIAYLDHLLERDGRVYLMTGHKSKGLEFDRVFFLDPHLCQIEKDQDANIKYVIETRAKSRLAYVTTKTFAELEEEVA